MTCKVLKEGSIRKYYKFGTSINGAITGSPTINNGIVSGFSSSKYITSTIIIPQEGIKTFEVYTKFTTGSTFQNYARIISSSYIENTNVNFNIAFDANDKLTSPGLHFRYNDNYTPYIAKSNTEANTTYWCKWIYDGTTIKSYYSTDGESYILNDTSNVDENTINALNSFVTDAVRIGDENQTGYNAFTGSIDLTQTYIKINGDLIWSGTNAVEYSNPSSNVLITGSLTNNDCVLSNFSTSNYAQLPIPFNPKNNDFEIYLKFRTPSSYPEDEGINENLVIFNPQVGLTSDTRFGIIIHLNPSGFLTVNMPNADGNNWYVDTYGGSIRHSPTLELNTWYYAKLKRVGDILSFYYSLNGNDWLTIFESFQLLENFSYPDLKYPFIGIRNNGSYYEPYTGKIDLKECYVKINDNLWWKGISEWDFYKDHDNYKLWYDVKRTYYKQFTYNVSDEIQEFVVPENITNLIIDCVASKGFGNNGGKGGRVQCNLSAIPGQTLYLVVGETGNDKNYAVYNASDIRTNNTGIIDTTSLQSRLIVAGGGGNDSGSTNINLRGYNGGGLIGEPSSRISGIANDLTSPTGGTQTSGGVPGQDTGGSHPGGDGANGSFGLGGNGYYRKSAGAGGAGWYGGGGGGAHDSAGGGAGGSSYTDSTLCSKIPNVDIHTQGYNNGPGYIKITYESSQSDYDYYIDTGIYKFFNV